MCPTPRKLRLESLPSRSSARSWWRPSYLSDPFRKRGLSGLGLLRLLSLYGLFAAILCIGEGMMIVGHVHVTHRVSRINFGKGKSGRRLGVCMGIQHTILDHLQFLQPILTLSASRSSIAAYTRRHCLLQIQYKHVTLRSLELHRTLQKSSRPSREKSTVSNTYAGAISMIPAHTNPIAIYCLSLGRSACTSLRISLKNGIVSGAGSCVWMCRHEGREDDCV